MNQRRLTKKNWLEIFRQRYTKDYVEPCPDIPNCIKGWIDWDISNFPSSTEIEIFIQDVINLYK